MSLKFIPLATGEVRALQAGGCDANGHVPERHISPGGGMPCRHCLADIAEGDAYLILAHRPFPQAQPYAELGPIFLHADACEPYTANGTLPPRYRGVPQILIKGYRTDDRIYYGTGQIIAPADLEEIAEDLFSDPEVAYIHARSATNNCYQFRIERG